MNLLTYTSCSWMCHITTSPKQTNNPTSQHQNARRQNLNLEWCAIAAAYVTKWHAEKVGWGKKARSMTFWSNAISQTAPGEGTADAYEYSTKLGMPVSRE